MVGRHPARLVVGGQEGPEVELIDEIVEERRQAVGVDPVMQAGRHQQEAVLVVRAERLGAHDRFSHPPGVARWPLPTHTPSGAPAEGS